MDLSFIQKNSENNHKVNITLSILVISHNQRELLRRCMDSILVQKINVPYEIIISDDRSSDGTWELIEEYMIDYPDLVFGIKCNSDECNPVNRSERCGWNKLNAYQHSRGKYFVNIDADDYLTSNDIYQSQIDALEKHPECSMCQQKVWEVKNGKEYSTGCAWPSNKSLFNGRIISVYDTIIRGLQGLNQSYLIRKVGITDPDSLYGKWYDDTVITLHHLQYGPAVFIDRSDYVWVKYPNSISSEAKGDDDLATFGLLPFCHALLIPSFTGYFMAQNTLATFHLVKKLYHNSLSLSEEAQNYYKQFRGHIFQACCSNSGTRNIRIFASYCIIGLLRKFHIYCKPLNKLLYRLLIGEPSHEIKNKIQWAINK